VAAFGGAVDEMSRRQRIVAALNADPSQPLPARLCTGAAQLTGLAGVGISAMDAGQHVGTICATQAARRVEELQFELGEGPCVEAHRGRRPVLVPDLGAVDTWPAFCRAALEAGTAAAFAFPLEVGSVRLGALSFYRDRPGGMDVQQQDDAVLLARVGVELLLGVPDNDTAGAFPELPTALDLAEWEVHQATGMVAVQSGVSVEDAFALLRGHAWVSGRSLREIAAEVVARRLRLDDR
jgi:hypothetical protein